MKTAYPGLLTRFVGDHDMGDSYNMGITYVMFYLHKNTNHYYVIDASLVYGVKQRHVSEAINDKDEIDLC